MNFRIVLFVVLTILFSVVSTFVTKAIVENSFEYRENRQEYCSILNYEQRLLKPDEYLLGKSSWRQKKQVSSTFHQRAEQSEKMVNQYSLVFGAVIICYLVAGAGLSLIKTIPKFRMMIAGLALVSLHLLVAGITSPMLEIAAFEVDLKIPFEIDTKFLGVVEFTKVFQGEMFFYYQSKSVLELISLLFNSKNHVVAIAILVFTVAVPVVKLLASIILLVRPSMLRSKLLHFFAFSISKWSMADVYVVATFLAYLSFNNMSAGIQTQSYSLPGLYFFLCYCMFSIFIASLNGYYLKNQRRMMTVTS